jgi:hypothetical protein
MLVVKATLPQKLKSLGLYLKSLVLKDLFDKELSVTYPTDISIFGTVRKPSCFEPTFLAIAERTKITVAYILVGLVLLPTAVTATFLVLLRFRVCLGQHEDWVIRFKYVKLMLGFGNLDDELARLLLELIDQIIHDINVDEATQFIVKVVSLALNVIIGPRDIARGHLL